MSTGKLVSGILVGTFVLMSLIPYGEKTNPPVDEKLTLKAPKEVMDIFQRSCFDCHSNRTKWPWYSSVFPMSWSVRDHVKNGRTALNFDKWNSYSKEKQAKLRQNIATKAGRTMPLADYLWLHEDAKLTKSELETIQKWAYKDREFELKSVR
ncbi:MAG: heme-binding domain-containing protein [Epsilonproteobacteria bacterium]|nr:heme-binding domain-containing protein [Campylobacterota bacterium]